MPSLLEKVRRGLSPAQRPTYKEFVIGLSSGAEVAQERIDTVLEGRTHEQLAADVTTYRERLEASAVLAETPVLRKREQQLKTAWEKARDAIEDARSPREAKAAQAAAQAAGDALSRFRHDFYQRRGRATSLLSRTADREILSRMGQVEAEIRLKAPQSLSREEAELHESAAQETRQLPAQIKAASGDHLQVALLKSRLAKATSTVKAFKERLADIRKAEAAVRQLEREREKLAVDMYKPENFELAK